VVTDDVDAFAARSATRFVTDDSGMFPPDAAAAWVWPAFTNDAIAGVVSVGDVYVAPPATVPPIDGEVIVLFVRVCVSLVPTTFPDTPCSEVEEVWALVWSASDCDQVCSTTVVVAEWDRATVPSAPRVSTVRVLLVRDEQRIRSSFAVPLPSVTQNIPTDPVGQPVPSEMVMDVEDGEMSADRVAGPADPECSYLSVRLTESPHGVP
jgi:hypothetical protein